MKLVLDPEVSTTQHSDMGIIVRNNFKALQSRDGRTLKSFKLVAKFSILQ